MERASLISLLASSLDWYFVFMLTSAENPVSSLLFEILQAGYSEIELFIGSL